MVHTLYLCKSIDDGRKCRDGVRAPATDCRFSHVLSFELLCVSYMIVIKGNPATNQDIDSSACRCLGNSCFRSHLYGWKLSVRGCQNAAKGNFDEKWRGFFFVALANLWHVGDGRRGAFTCDSTEFVSEPAPSSFDIPQSTKWHQILINTQSQTTNHPRVVLWRYRCKPRCPWSLTPSSHNIRNNIYTKRGWKTAGTTSLSGIIDRIFFIF